jgi:GST-like protein
LNNAAGPVLFPWNQGERIMAAGPTKKRAKRAKAPARKPRKAAKSSKSGAARRGPIQLYYWPTPNGHKVSILLEELGLPYEMHPVNINKNEQFAPAFLKISPNNRIPAILDPNGPGGRPISVFESGAILQYLGRKTGKLYPRDERARVAVDEWLMWQMGGLGPMTGQANHFVLYAPEDVPYGKTRYVNEVRRLLGVMNTRLGKVKHLAGAYSIADIACYSWVKSASRHVPLDALPNLAAWFERIGRRAAVQRGMALGRELRKP